MVSAVINRYRAVYSGLPREVWVLALVLFVNRAGTMVLSFLTIYLTGELKLSEGAAAGMVSIYGLGAVTGSYLGGRWAQRYGAVRVQTFGMLFSAITCLFIPLGRSWPSIALSLFVWSVASATVRPANAAVIAKVTTYDNRLRAFALQRLAANFGFTFGPAIGGLLASWRYGLLFVVDAATSLLAFAALVWFFGLRKIEALELDDDASLPPPRSPARDREFVIFLSLMFAGSCVFFQFSSTYPLYLRDHFGMNETQIGLMYAVNTLTIVLLEMLVVDAVKHLPLIRTVGWGMFLSCLGFGILPLGTSGAFAVGAMLVLTVGEMLNASLAAGYVGNRAPRGGESAYMGWYSLMLSLSWMVGPTIGGVAYQWNHDATWYGALVVGAAVLAGFLLLDRRVRAATSRTAEAEEAAPELMTDAAYPGAVELEQAL